MSEDDTDMTGNAGDRSGRSDGDDSGVDVDVDVSGIGYGEAVVELEAILAAIEDDAVDIDQLSRQVRRAAALIRLCQERIAGARIEVERVVADLAVGPSDPDDDWDPDDVEVDDGG
jgi:exodeoxyribonuclease VII small subunit